MARSKLHPFVLQGNHLKDDFNSHNRNCYQKNGKKVTKRKVDKVKNMDKAFKTRSKGKLTMLIPVRKGSEIIFPSRTK
jgi:hypothetical protein